MNTVMVVDNCERDALRYRELLTKEALDDRIFANAAGALASLEAMKAEAYVAAIVLWEIPGPPFGYEVLARCRELWPRMPVVVVTGLLDASLAARAYGLGAKVFLEKPLDGQGLRACLRRLAASADPLLPLVDRMREGILGESQALLACLQQVARAIPHDDSRILLQGESGTGKELIARAIHELGPRQGKRWLPINISAIPEDLLESELFGHERGAFTGAIDQHRGFLEEAKDGTLFLDEIGDLALPLQVKLNRVIQEKQFRRINGDQTLPFRARLVCASHLDLAERAHAKAFREDLYHRIAEVRIYIPPLREREGDVDILAEHFLRQCSPDNPPRLARETRTILRSYHLPGNVRELQNIIRAATVQCGGDVILPEHLPLREMGVFMGIAGDEPSATKVSWPDEWLNTYASGRGQAIKAFDQAALPRVLDQAGRKITRAASLAKMDPKTFRKRWEDSDLPPLGDSGRDDDDTTTCAGPDRRP